MIQSVTKDQNETDAVAIKMCKNEAKQRTKSHKRRNKRDEEQSNEDKKEENKEKVCICVFKCLVLVIDLSRSILLRLNHAFFLLGLWGNDT